MHRRRPAKQPELPRWGRPRSPGSAAHGVAPDRGKVAGRGGSAFRRL